MLLEPQGSSAGVFCNSAAPSEPGALASLVRIFSHALVSKPACDRFVASSVAVAELTTCQFGARSTVDADAGGATTARQATTVIAALRIVPLSTEVPPRPRFYSKPFLTKRTLMVLGRL